MHYFLMLISPPKHGHKHLWRLICGLLSMAKLHEPLMGIRDTGKVGDWKLAKSQIVINVSRMLILGLPWKQKDRPIGCVPLLTLISLSKRGVQLLWRLMYGLLTVAKLAQLLMDVTVVSISLPLISYKKYDQFALKFMKIKKSLRYFHSPVS